MALPPLPPDLQPPAPVQGSSTLPRRQFHPSMLLPPASILSAVALPLVPGSSAPAAPSSVRGSSLLLPRSLWNLLPPPRSHGNAPPPSAQVLGVSAPLPAAQVCAPAPLPAAQVCAPAPLPAMQVRVPAPLSTAQVHAPVPLPTAQVPGAPVVQVLSVPAPPVQGLSVPTLSAAEILTFYHQRNQHLRHCIHARIFFQAHPPLHEHRRHHRQRTHRRRSKHRHILDPHPSVSHLSLHSLQLPPGSLSLCRLQMRDNFHHLRQHQWSSMGASRVTPTPFLLLRLSWSWTQHLPPLINIFCHRP
jgi:hypothetical protein